MIVKETATEIAERRVKESTYHAEKRAASHNDSALAQWLQKDPGGSVQGQTCILATACIAGCSIYMCLAPRRHSDSLF